MIRKIMKFLFSRMQGLFYGFAKFGTGSFILSPVMIGHADLISIGEDTHIQAHAIISCFPSYGHPNVVISPLRHIFIGNNCELGRNLTIYATSENHGIDLESALLYGQQPLVCSPIHIEEGCWLGEKVCMLPGVTIGKRSIIGAGAVVVKSIPAYSISVGNPIKVIKTYNFNTYRWKKCEY